MESIGFLNIFPWGGMNAFSGFLADRIGLEQTFWILAVTPLLSAGLATLFKSVPADKNRNEA